MNEILCCVLVLLGALWMLIAALGLVRMPELFTRMQAATKASSLGAGLILVAVALHFWDISVMTRAVATVIFIFLTAPVAAHVLARVAYLLGVPFWEGTVTDELRDRYDREAGVLTSGRQEQEKEGS
jgi:multicomponent Na+:H+ antiporter subunit G